MKNRERNVDGATGKENNIDSWEERGKRKYRAGPDSQEQNGRRSY